jgi:polyisoprenoid-binding protein YceI
MVKKLFAGVLLASSLLVGSVINATKYDVDVNHSTVGFTVPILGGVSQVRGKFTDFNVVIDYDEADITKSSVTATIKAASIDTGIEKRDGHLKTADFFDVEKYPEITFQSKRIEKKGKNNFVAIGTFTMHGVSKEIELPIIITGTTVHPVNKKKYVGFSATLMLNRRDYGINYEQKGVPNWIGDEVKIELNLLANAGEAK